MTSQSIQESRDAREHRFIGFEQTREGAQEYCATHLHGTLATIASLEDNADVLLQLRALTGPTSVLAWFGAHTDDAGRWVQERGGGALPPSAGGEDSFANWTAGQKASTQQPTYCSGQPI